MVAEEVVTPPPVTPPSPNVSSPVQKKSRVDKAASESTLHVKKNIRELFTYHCKLQFLKKLDENKGNLYKTCKETGLKRSALVGWKKMCTKIEKATKSRAINTCKVRKVTVLKDDKIKKAKFVDLESDLAAWVDKDRTGLTDDEEEDDCEEEEEELPDI